MKSILTIQGERSDLLRRPAKRVKNVQSTEVILGIQSMKRIALAWEHESGQRCEGLAATQIGWNARVMMLRRTDEMSPAKPDPAAYAQDDAANPFDSDGYAKAMGEYKEWQRVRGGVYDPWIVMINPVLQNEQGAQDSVEGCLSCPGSAYLVTRPVAVIFTCTAPNGKSSGLQIARTSEPNEQFPNGDNSAVKFMHELNHLQGILVADIAREVYIGEKSEML